MKKYFTISRTDKSGAELYLMGKMVGSNFINMWTGNLNFAYSFDTEQEAFNYWNNIDSEAHRQYDEQVKFITL